MAKRTSRNTMEKERNRKLKAQGKREWREERRKAKASTEPEA